MDAQIIQPQGPETQDTGVEQQTVETQGQGPAPQEDMTTAQREPVVNTAQQNWNNGKRRIEQRQSLKQRVKQLEAELEKYKGKTDDYSRFRADQLNDRIEDLNAMQYDQDAADQQYAMERSEKAFADRATPFFGNETPQFMENVKRYGAYVNQNEPDLLKYVSREYGPILLHEWMQRMDQQQTRNQWLQMTAFEKGRVLDNLYSQIAKVIKEAGSQQQQQPNVPVPNGGRQSPDQSPTDDFGIELGRAFNRHKGQ